MNPTRARHNAHTMWHTPSDATTPAIDLGRAIDKWEAQRADQRDASDRDCDRHGNRHYADGGWPL